MLFFFQAMFNSHSICEPRYHQCNLNEETNIIRLKITQNQYNQTLHKQKYATLVYTMLKHFYKSKRLN